MRWTLAETEASKLIIFVDGKVSVKMEHSVFTLAEQDLKAGQQLGAATGAKRRPLGAFMPPCNVLASSVYRLV